VRYHFTLIGNVLEKFFGIPPKKTPITLNRILDKFLPIAGARREQLLGKHFTDENDARR